MNTKELFIATPLGHSLAAVEFSGAVSNGKSLVISSATGVLQGYYKKFASYFAECGYTVFTFDYSGIGNSGSELGLLKKNRINLREWGSNDQAALIDHAKKANPENQIILLTHSIGGQIIGFNPQSYQIDKIVMVASQSGYWKYFKGIHLPKMFLFWYGLVPLFTPLFGYFPARVLGLFENLPKNMAYEWMRWGKKKEYMLHFHNPKNYFFDSIKVPLLSLSFPKDEFAPENAVDWLTDQFSNAKKERIHYIPAKDELGKLRHFGFFRERFKTQLWDFTHEWIEKS